MALDTDTAIRLAISLADDTRVGPMGELRWKSNDRPVPMDVFKSANIVPPARQKEADDKWTSEFLADYRKNYKGPSEEEKLEARAAHGRGVKLVNVITGHSWRT